ncbi:glycoside hydrolase [bacterium]|nr:glycoside hydrolase [bacterium]
MVLARNLIFLLVISCFFPCAVEIQAAEPTHVDVEAIRPGWWSEARFGLFIHWGLYAVPAWHEQIQYRQKIPREAYTQYVSEFNPVHFDPHAWLDVMDEAGMDYICFTTKHIDGFCMWDTDETDYSIMSTPYGKDTLKMLAAACHEREVPLCLYYSLVDHHHKNYPHQGRAHERAGPWEGDRPNREAYLDSVCAQVKELCTRYGNIHTFWWDANRLKGPDPGLNKLIRRLQPGILINNRGFGEGDFGTPERDYDRSVHEVPAYRQPTEACQSVGVESWGYKKDEDYYSERYLMQSIDRVLAKGGNYLLNVGPKADGTLPRPAVQRLRAIGKWYHAVKESFVDAVPASHLTANEDVLLTRKDNVLYVHLNRPPKSNRVMLHPIQVKPKRAVLLNSGEPVDICLNWAAHTQWQNRQAYLRLRHLPVEAHAKAVMVIRLDFEEGEL